MGFPRQEYWSGLLFPSPGDLPDPGIEPVCVSSIGRVVLYHFHHGSPMYTTVCKTDSWWGPAVQHRGLSLVLCDDLEEWDRGREVQEGGDLCLRMAASLHCTAETDTTL